MKLLLKQRDQISVMRAAGKIVADTLLVLQAAVRSGVTTHELDTLAEQQIRAAGATPAYKGYRGFPATICASVNDEVVHGIPGPRRLQAGDIISLDVGARYRGYYGDATITVAVGDIDAESARLMRVCREALDLGIAETRAGNRLTDISAAVQRHVEAAGFSVVRDLFGHGIGKALHEEPMLPHYGAPGHGPILRSGMVLTIEPMIAAGRPEWRTLDDGWTVVTIDGSRAAQYEHTVAITDNGPEILTRP